MTARWKRASSGPASRKEARISSASSRSISTSWTPAAQSATSLGPRQLTSTPIAREDLEHRLDVADARDVAHDDLVLGEDAGGEDRQRAVLVAGRNHRAGQRDAAFDDELLHELWAPPAAQDRARRSWRLASVTAICSSEFEPRRVALPASAAPRRRAVSPSEPPQLQASLQSSRAEIGSARARSRLDSATRTHVRAASVRRAVLSYEHMFSSPRTSTLAQRTLGALGLARSFLLLEDDYEVDWEVDQDERGRGGSSAPSGAAGGRAPGAPRRRAGQPARAAGLPVTAPSDGAARGDA